MDCNPWNSPGQKNGYPFPSPGDLPNQASNPGHPHCRWVLYQLSHQGSPRTLEWVAYPFSKGIFLIQDSEPGSPILQMDSLPTELLGIWASLLPQTVKDPPCRCRRHRLDPRVGKIPWRRKWQPTPVFLPEESHGQRSLAGYSPWGHKESDTTGRLTFSRVNVMISSADIY